MLPDCISRQETEKRSFFISSLALRIVSPGSQTVTITPTVVHLRGDLFHTADRLARDPERPRGRSEKASHADSLRQDHLMQRLFHNTVWLAP